MLTGFAYRDPRWHALALALLLLALLLGFWSTFASMAAIWMRSATFAHGFLVVPVSAWLIWRQRRHPALTTPSIDWRALPLIWLLGFGWLLGDLADVQVVQQLAAVGMIPALFWLLLGWPALRPLLFPLGFLAFAVPLGESLIGPLIQLTAVMTVTLLHWSGIPVYSDGTFFSIPSGDWSVVAACSGIRYLIASLFLGVLYAYFSYRTLWRRLAFIALSIVVPILANGLRAYMIVMIGHLSDMRLAVGIDHFIYGWVFFGIVMFLLFAVGRLWSEPQPADAAAAEAVAATTGAPGTTTVEQGRRVGDIRTPLGMLPWLVAGLLSMLIWPWWSQVLSGVPDLKLSPLVPPGAVADWEPLPEERIADWTPHYLAPSATARMGYRRGEEPPVGLFVALYAGRNAELVNSLNVLVTPQNPVWRMPVRRIARAAIERGPSRTVEARLQSSTQQLLVWRWYWIDGTWLTNEYLAKFLDALNALGGRARHEAALFLYTPVEAREEDARARLRDFAAPMLPRIDAMLRATRPNASQPGQP